MNTEFEWRSQMRKLARSVEPARELWPDVAARIGGQRPRRRLPYIGVAIAAALILACAAGLIAQRMVHRHSPLVAQAEHEVAMPRTALDWMEPANPTLAEAAQDLDGASAQLQQALEQQPDAVFLVGMLNRTNGQRLRLLQQSASAG